MRFYSVLIILLLGATAVAEDKAMDDILKKSKDIVNDREILAGDIAGELSKIKPTSETNREWLKQQPMAPGSLSSGPANTAQQRAWNEIMGETEKSTVQVKDQGPPRPKVPDDVLYVYFSLSMPEETIRALFNQALEEDNPRKIIFVLRGWAPLGLNNLVAQLNELFPEAQKLGELPNVQINPNLYDQQSVTVVPTFSTKDERGQWRKVVGSTSLKDAIRRVEKGLYDGEITGPTFEIAEPNILKLIKERIAEMDWKGEVERVKKTLLTKKTSGRDLPYAEKDDSYLVDLTITNKRDLKGTSGELFAASGASVNPLDYMTVRKKYVFFDANDPNQLAQAKAWRLEHDYTTMITTVPVKTVERRTAVLLSLNQPVHEINDILIKRFRLKAVPSIVYQEGKMMRVDVKSIRRTVTLAKREDKE